MPVPSLEYARQCEAQGGGAGRESASPENFCALGGSQTSSQGSGRGVGGAALCSQFSEPPLFIAKETGVNQLGDVPEVSRVFLCLACYPVLH